MTGAGSTDVVFGKEGEFMNSLLGAPDYYEPGTNVTVEEISLQRALQRFRRPSEVEAIVSKAQSLEGAFNATWVADKDRIGDVHDIVFNDSGSSFTSGLAATSRWFVGVDYISSIAERELRGVTPVDYSLQYQEGGAIQQSLTCIYGDEETNTSFTPSSVNTASSEPAQFHGASFDIDTKTVTKMQSATLSISNIARFHRGTSHTPLDAVIAAPETSLDTTATFGEHDTAYTELAYGGSGQTSTTADMDAVAGEITLDIAGTTVATYTLPQLKPDQYGWDNIPPTDESVTESITWHVNGGVSVA